MRTYGTHQRGRRTKSIALIAVVFFGACSGLRLPWPLVVDDSDWATFAKYETRVNATSESVIPPLTQEWEYDITGGIGNGTPLVIDSVLIIGNLRGELYGINAYSGKRIGWIDLGEAVQGTPVIDGNTAIVALSNTDLSLVRFDLSEGKAQWKKDYGDIEASPLLHHQKIFVGNVHGLFFCVDRITGDELWKYELPENTKQKGIRSSAAGTGNAVVFGAEDGFLYSLDAESGKQQWSYNTGTSIVSSPCVAKGNVYIGNLGGRISAIDCQSGTPQWHFETGTAIYASAAVAGNSIFVGTTGGMMFAMDAATGAVLWKTDLGGVINSSAMVAGNVLYVGTLGKTLFGINSADGTILLKQGVPGRIKTSPVVARGRLFIATDEKLILAFKSSTR